MDDVPKPPTLGAQNRDVIASYLDLLPSDVRDDLAEKLITEYESSGAPKPPDLGTLAPDFSLYDSQGHKRILHEASRPVVLSFYRGGWCQFCANALRALQRRLPAIQVHNGIIWGISPETPESAKQTARENRLGFPLLFDRDNRVADLYGLRWSFAPILMPVYERYGIEPPEHLARLDVPFPATIIVDIDHTVVETFMDQDPSIRMEPGDVAAVVRQLKADRLPD